MRKILLAAICLFTSFSWAQDIKTPPNPPSAEQKTNDVRDDFVQFLLDGINKENQAKYQEAIDLYTRAAKIDEESAVAYIRRAVCYAKLNRNKEAADDLWKATHIRPKTIGDFSALSWLHSTCPIDQFRDGTLAVAYAKRALKDTESAEYDDLLAAGYAEMGEFSKARETLKQAFKYFPDSPRIAAMKDRFELYKQKKKYREDWSPVSGGK